MLRIGISGHVKLDPRQMTVLQQAVQKAIDFIEQEFRIVILPFFRL